MLVVVRTLCRGQYHRFLGGGHLTTLRDRDQRSHCHRQSRHHAAAIRFSRSGGVAVVSTGMSAGRLAGRIALVTGVSRRAGIGYAVVERLQTLGASVFASGWSDHDAEMPWGADDSE